MLVDTHCHLSDDKFAPDRAEVVAAARTAGVHHIVVVADSVEAAKRSVAVSAELGLSATAGVHPHVAGSWSAEARSIVLDLLDRDEVVAVGEIGLDYHYDFSPRDRQRKAFEDQLRMAAERNIPAVVHAREADADMADMIRAAGATVVMHSFSAGDSVLEAALDAGHYVSFSGMTAQVASA
ncbi:MAG: TatD family hydrolase, partial [Gemmatimonadales bacterium]